MRAGKALSVTATEVTVDLDYPPKLVFGASRPQRPNYLRFRLSPDVVIALGARTKKPGETMAGEQAELKVLHRSGDEMSAYERLIGDAMVGDSTLFARQDSAEAQWRIVDPILGNNTPLHEYDRGSMGPAEASEIAKGVGGWHEPDVPDGAPP